MKRYRSKKGCNSRGEVIKRCERQRIIREAERARGAKWWYISFADGSLPEGEQFLGACFVKAQGEMTAVGVTHLLNINPGGEVMIVGPMYDDQVPPEQPRWRLMQREEIDAVDNMIAARQAIEARSDMTT